MSAKAIAWAFERRGLIPTTRNVLFVLADSSDKFGVCWPGLRTIAHCAEISVTTARKAVRELAASKLMTITERTDARGRATSHVYQLHPDARVFIGPEESDEATPQSLEGSPLQSSQGHPSKSAPSPLQPAGGSLLEPTTRRKPRKEEKVATLFPESESPKPSTALPEWVPAEMWEEFLADRRERKKPMTSRAQKMALDTLAELYAAGHAPTAVLKQSIECGWQKLYPLKTDKAGTKSIESLKDRNRAAAAAFVSERESRDA